MRASPRIYACWIASALVFASGISVAAGDPLASLSASPAATKYDFSYRSTDDQIQVFDDGQSTRIQIPEGVLIPTMLAIQPQGEVLLQSKRETPYLVIPGVYNKIVLRWMNRKEVVVMYQGASDPVQRYGRAASFGSVAAAATYGAMARPQAAIAGGKVEVADQGAMPALAQHIEVAAPVASVAKKQDSKWTVAPEDKFLSVALERWASLSGVKLLWELDQDFPVKASKARSFDGSLTDALKSVLNEASKVGVQLTFSLSPEQLTVSTISAKGN